MRIARQFHRIHERLRSFIYIHFYAQPSLTSLVVIRYRVRNLYILESVQLIESFDSVHIAGQQRGAKNPVAQKDVRRLQRHALADRLAGKVLVAADYKIREFVYLAAIDIENHQLTAGLIKRYSRRDGYVKVSLSLEVIA